MRFTKMEGCGNDYVYVDGGKEQIALKDKPDIVRKLSDRHFGIGGDGVIFINPSDVADFEMEMYNADGSRSEMCGNGIRCVAKFVYDKGLTSQKNISVVSADKIKYLELTTKAAPNLPNGEEVIQVRVNMGEPILVPQQIPVKVEGEMAVDTPITVGGTEYHMTCVSMGNPHAVVFVEDTEHFPLEQVGPLFEHHELFPKRVNAEFVQIIDDENVNMRVWERGTGETLACGTGCCATAVACVLNGKTKDAITVHVLGGDIHIRWDRETNLVYMTGPATTVFEGEVQI